MTWASHLAITDETGQAFHYAQRSEIGPQVDHRPAAERPERLRPRDRPGSSRACRRRAIAVGHARRRRARSARPRGDVRGGDAAAAPGGLGLDLRLTPTQPAVAPRRRRLGRLRAGRRVVLLLADRDGCRPARSRWTAARSTSPGPPGSTTSGATSSRSAAVAGTGSPWSSTTAPISCSRWSGQPMEPIRSCTARWSTDRAARRLRSDGVPGDPQRDLAIGPDRAPSIRRAGRSRSPASDCGSGCSRPCRTRSSTRERPPASSTGRARRSSTPPGTAAPSAVRRTWS